MILYTTFIDLLNKKNIKLFDFQKRISHYELNMIYNKDYSFLENMDKNKFKNIILALLNKNYNSAKILLQSI